MLELNCTPHLTWDDILLTPQSAVGSLPPIRSRSQVDITTEFLGHSFQVPIMNAPMDSICSAQLYQQLTRAGALPVDCRFTGMESTSSINHFVSQTEGQRPVCISVGTDQEDAATKIAHLAQHIPLDRMIILIDTANGYSPLVEAMVYFLRALTMDQAHLIAGNVITAEGAETLWSSGVDCVRVGIGNGSSCSTRLQTGMGAGQVTALMEIVRLRNETFPHHSIVADGGIRHPGDMVKALALGADMVMMGRPFAGCNDCPEWVWSDDHNRAVYRGMASKQAMCANGMDTSSEGKLAEGEATWVDWQDCSAYDICKTFERGLRSAMSYANTPDLDLFKQFICARRTTPHVLIEGQVRY